MSPDALLCAVLVMGMAGGEDGAKRFEEVYRRAGAQFQAAVFFKPVETNTQTLTFKLAPLLMQEWSSRGGAARFGTLMMSKGVPTVDLSRPVIYFGADLVEVNGKAHARFTYVWVYGGIGEGEGTNSGLAGTLALPRQDALPRKVALARQGVRITLDGTGQPAIWEVMADGSGARIVFVSQSLETAAVAEFGKPLPGRRYAVERGLEEAPKVVVARVIDDGPVPMGPIVHVRAEDNGVGTLICRCMAVQVKELEGTETYALRPCEPGAIWTGGNGGLGNVLRVPRGF